VDGLGHFEGALLGRPDVGGEFEGGRLLSAARRANSAISVEKLCAGVP
jgi:hypothetical protein